MKKCLFFAAVALAAAVVFSCQKNTEIIESTTDSQVFHTYTFIIDEPIPDTKMAYTVEGSKVKTQWEAGDEILIHGKWSGNSGDKYYSRTVTLSAGDISADGKTASFTIGEITDGSYVREKTTRFAAYPASAVAVDNGAQSWYSYTYFNTSNAPILVGYNDTDLNDGNTFKFLPACGVISFKVDGDYDGYTFTGKHGETVGYEAGWRSNVYKTSSSVSATFVYDGSGKVPLTQVNGSLVADGLTDNLICIPNGVSFSGGFTIYIKKDGTIKKTISTSDAIDVPRGSFLTLGDLTLNMKDPVAHDSSISLTGSTALDGSGNANCYIVSGASANQVYTFKAYRGNTTGGVGTIASASILWETYNDDTDAASINVIEAVDFEKKADNLYYTMVFQMPAAVHAGNALIAAKDKDDNILWSWHIWVPETEIANVDAGFAAAGTIMDRNLGALIAMPTDGANVKALGMYYQWGRKDPLCGTKIQGTPSSAMRQYVSGAAADYDTSIQNPTVFYYIESSNWLSTNVTTLWDEGEGKKTQYDPCPPGYKVPVFDATYPMWNKDGAAFGTNWTWDGSNAYAKYSSATAAFPLGGYLNGTGQGESGFGSRAEVWSATPASSSRGNGMLLRDSAYNAINPYKSQGGNVRCVAE